MELRKFIISLCSFLLSVALFVAVIYAWFVQGTRTQIPDLLVDTPIIDSYEIHYFTRDKVYRYDSTLKKLLMYNNENPPILVEPDYNGTENQGKPFSGIFMGKYDPLLSINNNYNNIIIEFKINYTVSKLTIINLSSIIDSNLSLQAIEVFDPDIEPNNIYYLSSFAYIQYMIVDEKVNDNIFETVTEMFNDSAYPKLSFNESKSELFLTDITLDQEKNEQYFYINISYNEQKITDTFSSSWGLNPVVDSYHFFQDIIFVIRKKELE